MRILVSGFEPFDGMTTNVSEEVVRMLPESLKTTAREGGGSHPEGLASASGTGGDSDASSAEIASLKKDFTDFLTPNLEIHKVILPVSFKRSFQVLKQAIDRLHPEVIIAFGLAVTRNDITVERVALNVMDARTPDNDGFKPVDEPVVKGGDVGLWSTLPLKEMVASSLNAGVPASVSNSAGAYVCNQVMYLLLDALKEAKVSDVRIGAQVPLKSHLKSSGSLPGSQSELTRAGFIHLPPKPAEELFPGVLAMLRTL